MKKKLALFPVTRVQCALSRHSSLLNGFDVSYLFVPRFWALDGKDACCLDGGEVTNRLLHSFDKELLMDIDVLFVDYNENINNMAIYESVISAAMDACIEIILSREIKGKLESETPNLLLGNNYAIKEKGEKEHLYQICCPVITVLTQGIRTDQFAVELSLRKHFLESGYRVSQIGSHDASGFFGFSGIPSFLHESFDAYEKILKFNHYVKNLAEEESPELLIIGVPNAIMKYNDEIPLGFGILPSIICTAVESDLSILCMYYNSYNIKIFKEMRNYFHYHLRSCVNLFALSNTRISFDNSSGQDKLDYFDLESVFVMKGIENILKETENFEFHLFNALNSESINEACLLAHSYLTDNADFVR